MVVNNSESRRNFIEMITFWKIQAYWWSFFSYMVRKAFWSFWKFFAYLSYCKILTCIFFYWYLSIFAKSKHDSWKNENQFRKTFLWALHGLISYTFMWLSNLFIQNPGRKYILIETPKLRSKNDFLIMLKSNPWIFPKYFLK